MCTILQLFYYEFEIFDDFKNVPLHLIIVTVIMIILFFLR